MGVGCDNASLAFCRSAAAARPEAPGPRGPKRYFARILLVFRRSYFAGIWRLGGGIWPVFCRPHGPKRRGLVGGGATQTALRPRRGSDRGARALDRGPAALGHDRARKAPVFGGRRLASKCQPRHSMASSSAGGSTASVCAVTKPYYGHTDHGHAMVGLADEESSRTAFGGPRPHTNAATRARARAKQLSAVCFARDTNRLHAFV